MSTVAVVDYGMGNLRSVSQAVKAAAADSGHQVLVTNRPDEVRAAERVVLPGQGAMPDCMHELRASSLLAAVCGTLPPAIQFQGTVHVLGRRVDVLPTRALVFDAVARRGIAAIVVTHDPADIADIERVTHLRAP